MSAEISGANGLSGAAGGGSERDALPPVVVPSSFLALKNGGRMQLWVTCPHCGKKQFPVSEDTTIINLTWRCRHTQCRQSFTVNTSAMQGVKRIH